MLILESKEASALGQEQAAGKNMPSGKGQGTAKADEEIASGNSTSTSTMNDTSRIVRQRRKVRHRKLSKTQQKILWRRNRLAEYLSQGYSLQEISSKMQINYKTIWDDSDMLKEQAKANISNLISDLPHEVELCCRSLNRLMVQLYELQDPVNNNRVTDHNRILSMSLIKDCLHQKMELLTDSSVINESLKFIDSIHREIENRFNHDMKQVKAKDEMASQPIYDAISSNVTLEENNNKADTEVEQREESETEEEEEQSKSEEREESDNV